MAYEVDWTNTLINITNPQTDVVIQELHDVIRDFEEQMHQGVQYDKITNASGKEDLGDGVYVGITVTLLDTWQIKFWDGNYIAKVSGGNLVGGPSGDPVAYSPGVQTLLIQSAASTIVYPSESWTSEEKQTLFELMYRNLGLAYENTYRHTITYNGDNTVNTEKLDAYDSAANADTHDGVTGLEHSWELEYTYEDGKLKTLLVTKQ